VGKGTALPQPFPHVPTGDDALLRWGPPAPDAFAVGPRAVHSPLVTTDGSLAAHSEHTIAITEDGPEILTGPQC
jgi:hypothetical protein